MNLTRSAPKEASGSCASDGTGTSIHRYRVTAIGMTKQALQPKQNNQTRAAPSGRISGKTNNALITQYIQVVDIPSSSMFRSCIGPQTKRINAATASDWPCIFMSLSKTKGYLRWWRMIHLILLSIRPFIEVPVAFTS